jgi:ribosomal protein L11 methyltransferase
MKRDTLWQASVKVPAEAEEAALEWMGSVFQAGASSYRKADAPLATISVYCPTPPDARLLGRVRDSLGRLRSSRASVRWGQVRVRRVRRENWAESWKRHFKPLVIGRRLLIRPSWSRRRAETGQRVVILDPGLSFGTGHHPTTEFCLRQVAARLAREGTDSFLDLGTGSGILAIAAAKLGCRRIDAMDHDPDAIRVARQNARRNRVGPRVRWRIEDLRQLPLRAARTYDLVCANLTSDLLIAQRRRIVARVRPGGVLVLAGILRREFGLVAEAYTGMGLVLVTRSSSGEWTSGRFAWRG